MFQDTLWNGMVLIQVKFPPLFFYVINSHCISSRLETIVAPFTSDFLASYLSQLPSAGDAVLSFGPIDTLLAPAQHYIPTRLYNLFPHPAQDATEKRKYIAVINNRYIQKLHWFSVFNRRFFSRNADVPRALVRDMYTKSWSAFDRLVAIVPPGGSIGYVINSRASKIILTASSSQGSTTNSSASGIYNPIHIPSPA
jgi:hypothetical protein